MGINAVVKSGLEEQAHKLKREGCSDQKIANELSELSGQKISRSAVFRYFESHQEIVKQVSEKSELLAVKTINRRLDVAGTLLENVQKTDEALTAAIADHSWGAVAKLLGERRMNAEAAAKITGMIQGEGTTVNVQNNNVQGVKLSNDELLHLIRLGEELSSGDSTRSE